MERGIAPDEMSKMAVIVEVTVSPALARHRDLCREACFGIWRRGKKKR